MSPWLILSATVVVAAVSAYLSSLIRSGFSVWWYYIAGVATIVTWGWMAQKSPWTLLTSGMAWDIAYNVTFLLTLALVAGDSITWKQGLGVSFFLAGFILTSSH